MYLPRVSRADTLPLELQNGIFTSSTSKTIILFATDESLYFYFALYIIKRVLIVSLVQMLTCRRFLLYFVPTSTYSRLVNLYLIADTKSRELNRRKKVLFFTRTKVGRIRGCVDKVDTNARLNLSMNTTSLRDESQRTELPERGRRDYEARNDVGTPRLRWLCERAPSLAASRRLLSLDYCVFDE